MSKKGVDVLFLSHRYDVKSGGEKALLGLVKHTINSGLKAHVIIGSSGNIVQHLKEMGASYSITYLPYWAHGGNDKSPFEFTSLNPAVSPLVQLVDLIHKLKPRTCVTNTIVTPWLAYAAAITNTPHVWMIHEVHSSFNFRYALGKKKTYEMINLLSDRIAYNSLFTANEYMPYMTNHKHNYFVVYPVGEPVAPDKSIPSPFDKDTFKLIVIGGIKKQKGQLDGVIALKKLVDNGVEAQLAIVGSVEEPHYMLEIQKYIDNNSLASRVIFTGQVDNPYTYIELSDVLISSAVNESFGRVIVEAMFQSKPTVGAKSAGTEEIILSGKTGYLYSPGDSDELSAYLHKIATNSSIRKQLGAESYHQAKKYSTLENYKEFIHYARHASRRSALDLSMLEPSYIDFIRTVNNLDNAQQSLGALQSSKLLKIRGRIVKLFKKFIP